MNLKLAGFRHRLLLCISVIIVTPSMSQENRVLQSQGIGLSLSAEINHNKAAQNSVYRMFYSTSYLRRLKQNDYFVISAFFEQAKIHTNITFKEQIDTDMEYGVSFGYQRFWTLTDNWFIQGTLSLWTGQNRSASYTHIRASGFTSELFGIYHFGKIEFPIGFGYRLSDKFLMLANVNLLNLQYSKGTQSFLSETMDVDRLECDLHVGRLILGLNYYF